MTAPTVKPEQDQTYQIQRLTAKVNQDQVEIAQLQEGTKELQSALERKIATSQEAAWAVDRAIRTIEAGRSTTNDSVNAANMENVLVIAQKYCEWVAQYQRPDDEMKTAETMQ